MKGKIVLAVVLLLITGLVVGCRVEAASMAQKLNIEAPQISSLTYSWGGIDAGSSKIDVTLTVRNPNPVTIGLSHLSLDAYINDSRVASVDQKTNANLPAKGEGNVNLRVVIDTDKFGVWVANHVKQGELSRLKIQGRAWVRPGWLPFPYPFTIEHSIKTNLLQLMTIAQGKSWKLLPEIGIEYLRSTWGEVTPEYLQINHQLKIDNHTITAITLPDISYQLLANGIVLIEGKLDQGIILKPGDNYVLVTTLLRTGNVVGWWTSHMNNGGKTIFLLKLKPGTSPIKLANGQLSIEAVFFGAEIRSELIREITLSGK